MKVYIINYRGTIYGVFDSAEKANAYAERTWSKSAVMYLDVNIMERDVL